MGTDRFGLTVSTVKSYLGKCCNTKCGSDDKQHFNSSPRFFVIP